MTEHLDAPTEGNPPNDETETIKPDFTNALRLQRRMIQARSDPNDPLHSLFRFSDEIHEELDGPYIGPRDIM